MRCDKLRRQPQRFMTAYRFCRTDDIDLLVEAWARCRGPEDAAAAPLDRDRFKLLIRDLDLWCSSCMVAFEGREPVGVLLGAKRPRSTLVYGLRVHPEYRRLGHARHLLTSLGQKLAILGPPELVAEIPAEREAARAAFAACGWIEGARLTDWRREHSARDLQPSVPAAVTDAVAPITLRDLLDAGILTTGAETVRCWQRDLVARPKIDEDLAGIGFHSADRLEAWVLHRPGSRGREILAIGCVPGDLGRLGLSLLIDELGRLAGEEPLLLPRAAPDEIDPELLRRLGFEPGSEHVRYTARAQAA